MPRGTYPRTPERIAAFRVAYATHWLPTDQLSPGGLRRRVRTVRGTPAECEECGQGGPSRVWARVDPDGVDVMEDFVRLCRHCLWALGLNPGNGRG